MKKFIPTEFLLENKLFVAFWFLFSLLHIWSLDHIPWLFIDETWISEKALNIIMSGQGLAGSFPNSWQDIASVSPFGYLRVASIWVFGYTLFAIRLPSLVLFLVSLFFWYAYVAKAINKRAALGFVAIYSIQIPVFFAAHIARTESATLLLLSICLVLTQLCKKKPGASLFTVGLIGTIAFYSQLSGLIVPFCCGFIGAYEAWRHKQLSFKTVLLFILGCAISLGVYFWIVPMSDLLWVLFGPVGTANLASSHIGWRLLAYPKLFLFSFFKSTYHYLFFSGAVFLIFISVAAVKTYGKGCRNLPTWIPALIGFFASLLFLSILGRASRLYFVHLYPWLVLIFVTSAICITNRKKVTNFILITAFLIGTIHLLLYSLWFQNVNTDAYNQKLQQNIPEGATVLGRIQHQLAFGQANRYLALLDIANYGGTIDNLPEYVEKYSVDYIIYDDECRSRKAFIDLNIEQYLKTNGVPIATIKDPYYGSRYFDQRGSPFFGVLWFWTEKDKKPDMYTTSIFRVLRSKRGHPADEHN